MTDLLKSLQKVKITPNTYGGLPEVAGIYVFYRWDIPIYIGKAINLKRRVSSYFDINLETKTERMIKGATELSFIKVGSELEALLLEAKLIRAYMPKYNIAAKDDKHPLYIKITKDIYPRVITVRKIDLNKSLSIANYGPFPSSGNVRSVLKMLRRIFPFSDHKVGKRPCLYSHIGLCNPCPSEISNIKDQKLKIEKGKIYNRNIKHIKSILDGKIDKVRSALSKDMVKASKRNDFEIAAQIRNQIQKLEYITRPQMPVEFYIQNPNLYEDVKRRELVELKKVLVNSNLSIKNCTRIECFDIAHLAGTSPAASMVTFIDGEADKNFYRHFRILQKKGSSDIDSMKEVIARRLKHFDDWGAPNLIIVDGGVSQVRAFTNIIYIMKVEIPVVGIVKNPDRLVVGGKKIKFSGPALNLVQRIRDEAHRFAGRYHHKLISASLVN